MYDQTKYCYQHFSAEDYSNFDYLLKKIWRIVRKSDHVLSHSPEFFSIYDDEIPNPNNFVKLLNVIISGENEANKNICLLRPIRQIDLIDNLYTLTINPDVIEILECIIDEYDVTKEKLLEGLQTLHNFRANFSEN